MFTNKQKKLDEALDIAEYLNRKAIKQIRRNNIRIEKNAFLKVLAIQEPRKEKTIRRNPSKGSNTFVCSLKSDTQPLDDSLDWTGKRVRGTQRKPAFQQDNDDLTKYEDELLNISIFKPKKRQQHGCSVDDEESKRTRYSHSQASGISSYTKPPSIPVTKTATAIIAPPAITNSKLLRGDTTALDEARFQRAEKELKNRVEAEQKHQQEQQQVKTPAGGGGGANVQLGKNNPHGI
uniref:Uncharacterized protein n=1 Tax=Panagrolaimus sp. ES5 TaxID=591445 RepID=A0AC34FJ41_9BILA